ncbi:hypothetical protein HETIRDRAFT_419812 [Heterobasidion irregulare TC 32-1]|uniref:Reverse transcriptase domain-containing protein n=1 Tax=Heterobasidion irregulare (strain TC 32-1) TaxID=747525 RepID=W4JY85_HETIT|nr:uncharacterized protein HETIRDRAFT_419812 [Heterobasidion irregulare TC 32-1]ETW78542.1 hypothetical protein HETIRDRAFT_419812 [Heterobasidion irregulare TC 32-1]
MGRRGAPGRWWTAIGSTFHGPRRRWSIPRQVSGDRATRSPGEGYDIHRVETSVANTPARKAEPAKAAIGKQTKHTNSQKLAEEASKGKPELSFEEIVPKVYWSYRKVFEGRKPGKLPPKRPWDHKIELKDDMEHSLRPKLYSLSPMEQEELKKFIDESLKKGFIRESKSHMASPFFFIKKKNGKLRPVMDYRKLNEITIKNKYPLPIIQELLDLLTEAEYFSLVDIDTGYNNILIDEKDVHKAATSGHLHGRHLGVLKDYG